MVTLSACPASPCLIAAPRTPFDLLRNVGSGHSVQQFIERVTRLTRWLEDGAQHQCSVFDPYFGTLAVADLKGIGDRLRDAHGETVSPPAEFNDHGASPQSRHNVYTMQLRFASVLDWRYARACGFFLNCPTGNSRGNDFAYNRPRDPAGAAL